MKRDPDDLGSILGEAIDGVRQLRESFAFPFAAREVGVVTTVTTGGVESRGLPAVLTDPTSILSKRSVYFDFDSYEVKSEYKDLVTAHA